ncbi:MAG: 5,6-dimethylbenzimidazole synthase [Oleispira antarctica]|uniref:Nitroreductase family protein n=1 Tax=Oleispira antarctica RB-8 TaxID=698738 RepID=R4YSR6_OLEAN|nr:5,6-dimethylbenzimidazole synthase [Oleispira antarctica]MBQ0793183.1 5,6-dimethylbenzimidazole synthase [Oleispira antarctica]CCK77995.1 Nitroreductase family protein [Oleispira antarctica RB-8]
MPTQIQGPHFCSDDSELLSEIMSARRDVRGNRFLADELAQEDIEHIFAAALMAPSVGFSQPWEFITITNRTTKELIADSFFIENEKAKALFQAGKFEVGKLEQYQQLKLEGILESPLNIAVFYNPKNGPVLGQTSMPDMGRYSVVCAIQNMWLKARSLNIGMGWVSILDPIKVKTILNAPADRELIAYLCLGKVDKFYDKPELETLKWQEKKTSQQVIFSDSY